MEGEAPKVVLWAKVYEAALALVYLALVVAGVVFLVADVQTGPDEPPAAVLGGLFIAISLPLVFLFGAGLFLRPTPNAWVFHLVLICIGLTSACCLPATIPLLIFWFKPETKAHFGRP